MRVLMTDFAVRCLACDFRWHSPSMADGLRVLGACPKCSGELEFAQGATDAAPATAAAHDAAPHLVLGLPRQR
jgi:hypothetical protein